MSTQELINLPFPAKFEMSPDIGALAGALAKARKVFKPIIKSSTNPFFKSKYAELDAVIDATKDGLSDNELVVIQPPICNRDGAVQIITILAHSSGQWIKSILDVTMSKADAQGEGAAITYGRRYAYSGVLSVASESDDDGNGAVSSEFKKPRKEESSAEFDQRTTDQQNISVAQIQEIDTAVKRTGKTEAEVVAALSFIGEKRIEHVKQSQFQKFLKWANGVSKAKGPSITDQIRMTANKKLWAVAAEHSIPEEDVKKCAYEKYHVSSMTELTAEQLMEMAGWVKSVAEQG